MQALEIGIQTRQTQRFGQAITHQTLLSPGPRTVALNIGQDATQDGPMA
ncbi:MAG: hypothetical protein H6935_00065 [Thiobacillus sp.]|nr:hypothetical protein [Thiobacillus sp.]